MIWIRTKEKNFIGKMETKSYKTGKAIRKIKKRLKNWSNKQMRQMPHLLIITSYGSQVPPTETVIPPFDEGL